MKIIKGKSKRRKVETDEVLENVSFVVQYEKHFTLHKRRGRAMTIYNNDLKDSSVKRSERRSVTMFLKEIESKGIPVLNRRKKHDKSIHSK